MMKHSNLIIKQINIYISRHLQSQGLLYKHLCVHWSVSPSVILCENIFTALPHPNGWRWYFQSKNRLCYIFVRRFKILKGIQIALLVLKVTAILLIGQILPIYWWSFSSGGTANSGATCLPYAGFIYIASDLIWSEPLIPTTFYRIQCSDKMFLIIQVVVLNCTTGVHLVNWQIWQKRANSGVSWLEMC